MVWIKTSTGCSPGFTIPACPPPQSMTGNGLLTGSSNAPSFTTPADTTIDIIGSGSQCVLVYTDDCSGNNPLIAALTELGIGYTHYFQAPYRFEAAVASDFYNLILVDHSCYYEASNAWDDLVAARNQGVCVGVASFDWDGSDDASGSVSSLLGLGGATHSYDIGTQGTLHVWNPSPIFTGLPAQLTVNQNFYTDSGDGWNYTTADAGWTSSPQAGQAAALIGPKLALLGFLPEQLSPSDGKTVWKNVINYLNTGGPTPTISTTWGSLKLLYR